MAKLDLLGIVDVESTGLNPTTDEVIELGCILYLLSHNCVLQQVSTLVPVNGDNGAQSINGISRDAANTMGLDSNPTLHSALWILRYMADAVVAHNSAFDKSFLESFVSNYDYDFSQDKVLGDTPWIDTRAITWPKAIRQGCSLVELALSYGIPVWSNHRALTDCHLIAHILQREPMAAELLAKELEPKVWATWRSVPSDKQGQARAKATGFRWNRPECPASQVWSRLMHPDDIQALPFEVVAMEVPNVA